MTPSHEKIPRQQHQLNNYSALDGAGTRFGLDAEERDVLGMLPVPPGSAGGSEWRVGTPGFAGLPTSAGGLVVSRPGTTGARQHITSAGTSKNLSTRPGTTSATSSGTRGAPSSSAGGLSRPRSFQAHEQSGRDTFHGGLVPGISELRDGFLGRPETGSQSSYPRWPQNEKAPGSLTNTPLPNTVLLDCFIHGRNNAFLNGVEEQITGWAKNFIHPFL